MNEYSKFPRTSREAGISKCYRSDFVDDDINENVAKWMVAIVVLLIDSLLMR